MYKKEIDDIDMCKKRNNDIEMYKKQIGDIEIFCINFSKNINRIPDLSKYLTKEELVRSEKYHFEKDKNQFIICRGYLRDILSKKIRISPEKILFEYNKYGKPTLRSTLNPDNINFNVSHSSNCGVIAITRDKRIGIDIEKRNRMKDMKSILKSQFSSKEYEIFNLSTNKEKCFFDIWAQKEAVVKATGMGFSFGLNHWSVNPNKDKYHVDAKGNSFFLRKLFIDDDYSAALAVLK